MCAKHCDHNKIRGLTLIELMISVLLISSMLIAVWVIFDAGYKVYYGTYARQNIKNQASGAFFRMTKELYEAVSVTSATATSMTFTADVNNDGINETIQYSWGGTSGQPLNRISGTETLQLARSVTNISFAYYDIGNILLSFPVALVQVRLVSIDMTCASGNETFHLRTKVKLRNI